MRKIMMYILIGFLILIMLSVVVRIGTWNILIKRLKMDNGFTRTVFFDAGDISSNEDIVRIPFNAKQEYPFTKNKSSLAIDIFSAPEEAERVEESDKTTIVGKVKRHINFFLEDRFLPYNAAVNLALIYEGYLKWTVNENAILIGNNYWILPHEQIPIDEHIASINNFSQFLQTNNVSLLYISHPPKTSPEIVYNFTDWSNKNIDALVAGLKNYGIPYIDLRENILTEDRDWHSLFYNTDHHWRAESGLWASKIIADKLNSEFGFDLDTSLLNLQNYNYKVYENWFLGSIGKKVGHYLAKPDDFTLITPKFETKFDVWRTINSRFATKEENIPFDSVFIDFNPFIKKDFYNSNTYGAYCFGDNLGFYHNKLNMNGKKILFLEDSNTNVIIPFFAIINEYIISWDLRHFDGSLETLIKKEMPDIVVISYFSLDKKLFDFR